MEEGGSVEQANKVSLYCKRRFSKENVRTKLSCYTTRVLVVLAWCGVLWAFLTDDFLPRQYVNYLRNRTPKPCIMSSVDIPAGSNDGVLGFLPPSWNDDLSNSSEYLLVALTADMDSNGSYQVLLVRQDSMCLNVFEFEGYSILPTDSGGGSGEASTGPGATTESLGMGTVDVLDLISSSPSTSLLDIPTGHFFALVLLLIVSSISGVLAKWIFLPPLIGMILAGFILRNVPGIDFARHISNTWSSMIRNIALVIVLIRGGFALDIKQLKRLKLAVLLLAVLPCVTEGLVDGILATFWLQLPWQFAFTLGYVVAAISPAIVIPTTLNLLGQGYGKESGVLTLIVAAASMDVVISISLFGVFLGLGFSDGGGIVLDVFRGPIQIVIGLLYGVICGLLLWIFPTKYVKRESKVRNRVFLTLGLSLFAMFGSIQAVIAGSNLVGSGALAILVLSFVAGQGWDKDEMKQVTRVFYIIWQFFEPLLFGLIGAAVDLQFISPTLVGQAVGLVLVGLIIRMSVSFAAVLGNKFSWLEMVFVTIAWLPKATVQAAIGSIALDLALARSGGREDSMEVQIGRQILTVAVIAVVMTAPLGALATSLLGPVLLKKPTCDSLDGSQQSGDKGSNNANHTNPKSAVTESKVSSEHMPTSAENNIKLSAIVVTDLDQEPKRYS